LIIAATLLPAFAAAAFADVSVHHAIAVVFSRTASPVPALGPRGSMAAVEGLALSITFEEKVRKLIIRCSLWTLAAPGISNFLLRRNP
jgi:hypothetical protein